MLAAAQSGDRAALLAIFGPGFTRSKYDLFLAADLNAARGIATIATDPAGHSYGPASVTRVYQGAVTTSFSGFGQGTDLDERSPLSRGSSLILSAYAARPEDRYFAVL